MAKKIPLLLAAVMLLCAAAGQAMAVTAFPGAEGFAANITGGRGGTVYHVTNLNDSGTGSLRDAVSTAGRIVVFDVGGVINITSPIAVSNNITIAGQTAPGGGIVVYGNAVSLSSHNNIIIRYLTCRQGINGASGDKALNMTTSYDIIIDHVSVAWGRWDTFGITSNGYAITIQNCILAEGILPQQFGGLIDSSRQLTLARNLFINNNSRNPKGKADMQYINNVIYNWGSNGYCCGHSSAPWYQDLINNYFIAGPSSDTGNLLAQATSTDMVYLSGNYVDTDRVDTGGDGRPEGRLVVESDFAPYGSGGTVPTFTTSAYNFPTVSVPVMSAANAYPYVISQAGNSLIRDGVDQRLITDVKSLGTLGALVSSEADVGGQPAIAGGTPPTDTDQDGVPDYFETAMGTNPAVADNNGDNNGNGYTNIEDYINWLGGPHLQVPADSYADIDLRPFTSGYAQAATYTLSSVTHGTAVMLADGHTVRFTAEAGYSGLASFTFTVNDGRVASEPVSVLVAGVGTPAPDTTAPTPNPMTFSTAPIGSGPGSVYMIASTASDGSGVEYRFTNVTDPAHDSGWQSSTIYTDTGLAPSTTYQYTVKARDLSSSRNETSPSAVLGATTKAAGTATEFQAEDQSWYLAVTETTNAGYTGRCYINTNNAVGSWVEWSINVPSAAACTVQFRYANGTSTDRPAEIKVNGVVQIASQSFPYTGAWTTWSTLTVTLNLAAGVNTIRLTATTANGDANLDRMDVILPVSDTTAPTPSPMTFATAPYATSTTSIAMVATMASDASGVEYLFTCTAGGGNSSAWQASTSYTDTDFTAGTMYTYTVTARDLSPSHNQTAASAPASATTPNPDTTAPTPNPMTFATAPYATGTTSIAMVATTASDASGVQYLFTCTAGGGHSSAWQASTSYTDTGLTANSTYTYTVMARDQSANQNQTAASAPASATTQAATPATPTYVAAGSVASGTGTIAPALPSGIATGDVLLLFVETANQAVTISNANGGTWTAVASSPQGTGTAAGTSATRLTAFWSRYNGTQGAPTVADSGDHQLGRIVAFRGVIASGDPWNVTAGGIEATADTSGAIPGATTTVSNTLVVVAIATALPDSSSTSRFSAWANTGLTSVTERTDNSVTAGNGGGLGIATGIKATAGAYGNTTLTLATSSTKGMMSIALRSY